MSTFARLLKLLTPFKWWVAFAVLLSFLTIGSSVGLMAMSAYLISKAALVTDIADIALAITTVRVFAIARAAFRYLERYYTHTATFRILAHLRVWFYASIEPLAPALPSRRIPGVHLDQDRGVNDDHGTSLPADDARPRRRGPGRRGSPRRSGG